MPPNSDEVAVDLPTLYESRPSTTAVWIQRFGAANRSVVDDVLKVVQTAFQFGFNAQYKFIPEDRIVEIYEARHPSWKFWSCGDSMELEYLLLELEQQFRIDFEKDLARITLGEIVQMVLDRRASEA